MGESQESISQSDYDGDSRFSESVTYVLEKYPGYRLDHFTRFSFLEGGVTFSQFYELLKHAQKREYDRIKNDHMFYAACHGVKIDGDKMGGRQHNEGVIGADIIPEGVVLGDPSTYHLLSPKQKKELTEKLMARHKFMFKQ